LSVSQAITNLSHLYRIKKDFEKALFYAEEGLRIRKAIYQEDNGATSASYHRLSQAQFAIYEDSGDAVMLRAAKENAENAVRTGKNDMFGDVEFTLKTDHLAIIDVAMANAGL